jgi:hypothetical protein
MWSSLDLSRPKRRKVGRSVTFARGAFTTRISADFPRGFDDDSDEDDAVADAIDDAEAAEWNEERRAEGVLLALRANVARRKMKTALHAAAARHARRRALTRDLRFWHATAKRNALLRRVFTICEKAWRAHVRVHGVHLSPEDVRTISVAREGLAVWRAAAARRRRAHAKKVALVRAETYRRLSVSRRHLLAWRAALRAARARERAYATFADAFASWRVEAKTAAAEREEAARARFSRLWLDWRARAATTAAVARMRRRALTRAAAPALHGWRIVVLARARRRLTREMNVLIAGRRRMWAAWRAWCLGPGCAALTRGAPTPLPPEHADARRKRFKTTRDALREIVLRPTRERNFSRRVASAWRRAARDAARCVLYTGPHTTAFAW